MSLTLLTALITPGEQQKSWDPNSCLLTSLIKADLHFHEWLAAGRQENSINWAAGQGERGGTGWQNSPCPSSGISGVHSELSHLVWSTSLGLSVNTALWIFSHFPHLPALHLACSFKKSLRDLPGYSCLILIQISHL